MKKLFLVLVCGLAAASLAAPPAWALPFFNEQFQTKYVDTVGNGAFKAAAEEAKCNVCHYSTMKKNRNSYGMALSKYLSKDNFKLSRTKAEPDVCSKEVMDALQKVASEKDVDGQTFGAKMKAGKLPGTLPPGAEQ
jgi:hypothetical protein